MIVDRSAIWAAAYGASFARQLHRAKDLLDSDARLLDGRDSFEVASQMGCELAMCVADAAVAELDRWIEQEGSHVHLAGAKAP